MRDAITCECQARGTCAQPSGAVPTPYLQRSGTDATMTREHGIQPLRLQSGNPADGANPCVLYSEDRGIATITLNRPKVKNAIDNAVYLRLVELLQHAAGRDSVVAVILTGSAGYFTSGADLNEVGKQGVVQGVGPALPSLGRPVGRFMLAVLSFPKVLIAAVNGPAVGIGVTLLPHCDAVYAYGGAGSRAPGAEHRRGAVANTAPQAPTFWTPFLRVGVVPEFGSSLTFPQVLGMSLANEMLMFGRKLSLEEAVSAGLVSRVITADTEEGFVSKVRDLVRSSVLDQFMAAKSSMMFKRIIQDTRRPLLVKVVKEELAEMDKRMRAGHPVAAVRRIRQEATGMSKL